MKIKPVQQQMKVKVYDLLMNCIERGLEEGWNKAHKHTDTPTPEQIWDHQSNYISINLDEWFEFSE